MSYLSFDSLPNRSALSPMSQTQMEPVVTEQQSTCQMNLTAAARNATLVRAVL